MFYLKLWCEKKIMTQLVLIYCTWFEFVVGPSLHCTGLKRLWHWPMWGCWVRLGMWLRVNSWSNLALWVVYKNKAVLLVNAECVRPAAGVVRATVHRPGGTVARFGSVDGTAGLTVWGPRLGVPTEAGFLALRLTAVIVWSVTTLWKNKIWVYFI